MSHLLYSVREVFEDYLSGYSKQYYHIPLYQRGYKWEPVHIEKLLNDIETFQPHEGKFYCLQNITLIPKDTYFNVVDGQQRLTTLTLILSHLRVHQMVHNKVRFPKNSIRRETNAFLNAWVTNGTHFSTDTDWDEFILLHPDFDHQDIGHLYRGYQTVVRWFRDYIAKRGGNDMYFLDVLLNSVKLIINRIDQVESEEKVFSNLNSKRVPLDGADLVRAMLITRVAHEEGAIESDIKNIVRVNERRVKIGWELDQINQWWSRPEIQVYFGRFKSVRSEETSSGIRIFNETLYPLNLLFLLFAEKREAKELSLELFERQNNNALGLYKELLKLHATLQDWHQDKQIYHFLGYLFNQLRKPEISFRDIWQIWEEAADRDDFIGIMKSLMKSSVSLDGQLMDYNDPKINWYEDRRELLVRSMIMMDIIHSLKEKRPFLPPEAFTKTNNDIEHIFPKTPDTDKLAEQKEYLKFLNLHVVRAAEQRFDLSGFERRKLDPEYQEAVKKFIEQHISGIRVNSIGNLVLLYYALNRSLQNATYPVKRAKVIAYFQEGHFIQPHTFQVFIRYFNDRKDRNRDLEHWTNSDIEANTDFITRQIQKFFSETL